MPLFNAEQYVRQAIDSLIQQTFQAWELIVVDDASTDGSAACVESVGDPRVRLLRREVNGGPGVARNVALDLATGEWLTVLDADDLFHVDRLQLLIRFANRYGKDKIYFDQVVPWHAPKEPPRSLLIDALAWGDEPAAQTVAKWFRDGSAGKPFFHRSALSESLVRYPDTRAAQDAAFVVRLAKCANRQILQLPIATYIYRRVPGSLAARTDTRFAEVTRTYGILQAEFASDPDLLGAIDDALSRLTLERQVMELRAAATSKKYGNVAGQLVRSPHLAWSLLRRLPTWLRIMASRRK